MADDVSIIYPQSMRCYTVNGLFHKSFVIANSEGEARRAFHRLYNGVYIVSIVIDTAI